MKYPKNKYRKGYHIYGMGQLTTLLTEGSWVYLDDKVVHPNFILNMQYKEVVKAETDNRFCEAINQKKEYFNRQFQRPYPAGISKVAMP